MADEAYLFGKRVESGPAEILDAGTVISFAGNPIALHYKELGINIIFEFATDDSSSTHVESSIPAEGTLRLRLFNFNDRFGAGTDKPMRIGKYDNHRLYLQLRVYTLAGSPDKTLQYTLYKGEEVTE